MPDHYSYITFFPESKESSTKAGIKKILEKYDLSEWPYEMTATSTAVSYKDVLRTGGLRPFCVLGIVSNLKTPPTYTPAVSNIQWRDKWFQLIACGIKMSKQ